MVDNARRLIKPTDSVLAVHVSYGNNHEEAQACVRRYKEVMDANNVSAWLSDACVHGDRAHVDQFPTIPAAVSNQSSSHAHKLGVPLSASLACCTWLLQIDLLTKLPGFCVQVVGEVLIHNMDRSLTVADSLLGLARIKQVDTLVLGISGYR